MKCYCCSEKGYKDCCQPYHEFNVQPDTAEQLMRSRYSAFVLLNEAYLRTSWAVEQCPQELSLDANTKWVKLDILSTEHGQKNDQQGKVEFKAWFIHEDQLITLHEISDFVREKDRWVYFGGRLFDEPVIPLSMNQQCPCGSGQKYKRCCRTK